VAVRPEGTGIQSRGPIAVVVSPSY